MWMSWICLKLILFSWIKLDIIVTLVQFFLIKQDPEKEGGGGSPYQGWACLLQKNDNGKTLSVNDSFEFL